MSNYDQFKKAYIEAMLWADRPEEEEWDEDNFSEELNEAIEADCAAFWMKHGENINDETCLRNNEEWSPADLAGHDFWLTRQGHGTGFWDSGRWEKPYDYEFSASAKEFDLFDVYLGDDGMVYGSGQSKVTVYGKID